MNRAESLARLQDKGADWEVLIIGGGATGLSAAVDAAARGYRTALVERDDFASATSSRSTKLIHGGLRYLQQGRPGLVRESLHERGRLLRNAPHLVQPLRFVVPNYKWHERFYYGAGLKLYDLLAGKLNTRLSEHLSKTETLAQLPALADSGLRGGIAYDDAQFDDARLAVALARTATGHGAAVANYVQATGFLKNGERVTGIAAKDLENGTEFTIHAGVVINATGVFTDEVRHLDNRQAAPLLTLSQGAHIVLDRSFFPGPGALIVPRTRDGRVLFVIPWQGRVLAGTTDTPVNELSSEPRPFASEIEFLLEHLGQYLTRKPEPSDILSAFAGLRPLVRSGDSRHTAKLSRSHRIEVSPSGLVTITGGKWTTCRRMAEDTIDTAVTTGGLPKCPCPTKTLRLHGWTDTIFPDDPLATYGADAAALRALNESIPHGTVRLHSRLPFTEGQVRWAVRHEMARTLTDVLSRRLRALFLDARAAMEAAPRAAAIMAEELGRDDAWAAAREQTFLTLAAGCLPADAAPDPFSKERTPSLAQR